MFMVERVSYSLIGVRRLRDVRTRCCRVGAFTLLKGFEKLMKMTMIDVFEVLILVLDGGYGTEYVGMPRSI
jgi:hypothetical protein